MMRTTRMLVEHNFIGARVTHNGKRCRVTGAIEKAVGGGRQVSFRLMPLYGGEEYWTLPGPTFVDVDPAPATQAPAAKVSEEDLRPCRCGCRPGYDRASTPLGEVEKIACNWCDRKVILGWKERPSAVEVWNMVNP